MSKHYLQETYGENSPEYREWMVKNYPDYARFQDWLATQNLSKQQFQLERFDELLGASKVLNPAIDPTKTEAFGKAVAQAVKAELDRREAEQKQMVKDAQAHVRANDIKNGGTNNE